MTRRVRRNDRTTGSTYWRKKRTGIKVDDCKIIRLKEPVLQHHLNTVVGMSGFESVAEWNNAIDDLHDGLNECGLYVVGESETVDTVTQLLQIVPL